MKKKGISLILLVITIIIIIIIASAVILNLNNNNPVDKARLANVEQTRDSLKSGINLYIGKIMVDENGNHRAQTMILGKNGEVEKYKIITGDFREDYETIFSNKQIWQLDYNRVNSLVNVKLDIYDANSRWYIDEYGNPYLVYDKLSNVAPYLKNEEGTDILSSVKDFVVYLDKDVEFSENTQPEPEENITSSIVITKNSNSTATISGFSRNGIKSITYTGPRQGTITPTMNGNYYTAVANVGNGDYTFTVTDNNDETLTKEETISGITSFTVGSVEDLCKFRDYVNMGDNFAGVTVTQTTDLDLSTVCSSTLGNWEPIGVSHELFFAGTYDGGNHNINNIYINNSNGKYVGLFGVVHAGKLNNITISGNITGKEAVAGICGVSRENIEFNNCINNVILTGEINVGGICGNSKDFKITNCINNGSITCSNSGVGGILGSMNDSNTSIIEKCINTVVISSQSNTGGIIGYITNSTFNINNCKNIGNITSNNYNGGGIVGCCNEKNSGSITNCYNKSNISAVANSCGGIIGCIYNDTTNTVHVNIMNTYSTGTITSNSTKGGILGFCSKSSYYTATNNYYETGKGVSYGIGSTSSNTGASGISSATLKGYASTLGDAYKEDTNNINDGYPILAWQ